MNTVKSCLQALKSTKVKRQKLLTKLIILSVIVAGSVSWSLHLNGESKTAETYCGIEEHEHDESCEEKTLICKKTEGAEPAESVHTHDDSCYEIQSVLTCTREEHEHSEKDCYDKDGNLICGKEEHKHSAEEQCYTEENILTCTKKETSNENAQPVVHVHNDDCYKITYKCGYKEHKHTLSCYSNPEADIEKKEDWEKAFETVTLSHDISRDICTVAKTQLGYSESTDNYKVVLDDEGNETEETQGWNRYGEWSGDPYSSWSADFIRFCLFYSGMPESRIPETQSCQEFIDELRQKGFYTSHSDSSLQKLAWMPETGDPVFFDTNDDGTADHAGIITSVKLKEENLDASNISNWMIETIEGDLDGKVQENSYDLTDTSILGFANLFDWYLYALSHEKDDNRTILTAKTEDNIEFTVIGEIPEKASLKVTPLTEEQVEALSENKLLKEYNPEDIKAFDIKIVLPGSKDGEDKIWEPAKGKTVSVSVSGMNLTPDQEMICVHLPDTDIETTKDEELKDIPAQEVNIEISTQRLSFQTEGFSEYAFISETGADSISASTNTTDDSDRSEDEEIAGLEASTFNVSMRSNGLESETLQQVSDINPFDLTKAYALTFANHNDDTWYAVHTSGSGELEDLPKAADAMWSFEKTDPDSTEKSNTYYIKYGNKYLKKNGTNLEFTNSKNNATALNIQNKNGNENEYNKHIIYLYTTATDGNYWVKAEIDASGTLSLSLVGYDEASKFCLYEGSGSVQEPESVLRKRSSISVNDLNGEQFVIASCNDRYAVTSSLAVFDYLPQDASGSRDIQKGFAYQQIVNSAAEEAAFWEFERTGPGSNTYLLKNKDLNQYLQAVTSPTKKFQYVDKNDATEFTVTSVDGDPSSIRISFVRDGSTWYMNVRGGSINIRVFSIVQKYGDISDIESPGYNLHLFQSAESSELDELKVGLYETVYKSGQSQFVNPNKMHYTLSKYFNTQEENILTIKNARLSVEGEKDYFIFPASEIPWISASDLNGSESSVKQYLIDTLTASIPEDPNSVNVENLQTHERDTRNAKDVEFFMEDDKTWYIKIEDSGLEDEGIPLCNLCHTVAEKATDTYSPTSTVINLFDYWVTEERLSDRDSSDSNNIINDPSTLINNYNYGINNNHQLKFVHSGIASADTSLPKLNRYNDYGVLRNIVKNQLVNGFPYLSATYNGEPVSDNVFTEYTNTSPESLQYLFDPTVEVDGKKTFSNVKNLLSVDTEGYNNYDCLNRYAYFNEDTNAFTVYTTPGVSGTQFGNTSNFGQFFPFNSMATASLNYNQDDVMNHYFGMTLTTRFIQQNNGYTTSNGSRPTIFEFSGDDDVWIFIDDVLVADLGGLHALDYVQIDFSTGQIVETYNHESNSSQTTLKQRFIDALGEEAANDKYNWRGNTFADDDNKAYTLKFFYLERGNIGSNLHLKYNLNEVPATAIYKVDQYGLPLQDARFAVYASDESGKYYNRSYEDGSYTNGTQSYTRSDSWTYDTDPASPTYGSIFNDGAEIISPLYVSETDSNGEMYFMNSDHMKYTLKELKDMFGEYFLLEEIDVPDGYRRVSDSILLTIQDNLLQTVNSSYNTGVWSSPNALVTATNDLYVVNLGDYDNVGADSEGKISYYVPFDDETGNSQSTVHGSLFAVVLAKKNDGDTTLNFDTWTPVYGNDLSGYDYSETGSTTTEKAINAAKEYGLSHVFGSSPSGMQVLLEELPGDPKSYYTYLSSSQTPGNVSDSKYLVAYYYTTEDINANGWDNVKANNTARVTSHGLTSDYDPGFSVQWGATIMVPNVENRLFVQKRDVEGQLINDALFAIYQVEEDNQSHIYYTRDDGTSVYLSDADKNNRGTATETYSSNPESWSGTYTILQNGNICVSLDNTDLTITPLKVAGTLSSDNANNPTGEDGTAVFKKLGEGKYVIREVQAPEGYAINPAEIKVLVNADAVYANAGSANDGVAVGNGVGYLVSTLNTFAKEGSIDETLTWIYSVLRVNNSQNFSDFSLSNPLVYVQKNNHPEDGYGSSITDSISQAMVTYLVYDPDSSYSLFEYRPSMAQNPREPGQTIYYTDHSGTTHNLTLATIAENSGHNHPTTQAGEGTMRLYSETGWTALEIYQDYLFGYAINSGNSYDYTDLQTYGIGDISNLFSNSTFIRVTDESITNLNLVKVDANKPDEQSEYQPLAGASFVLYKLVPSGDLDEEGSPILIPAYYKREKSSPSLTEADITVWKTLGEEEDESDYKFTSEDDPMTFLSLTNGTYYLKEIEAPDGYHPLTNEIELTLTNGTFTAKNGDQSISNDLIYQPENSFTTTFTVPNTSSYELPQTGGGGRASIILAGLLISTSTLIYGVYLHQDQRRKNRKTCSESKDRYEDLL